jgi:transcriptional regulator with XRE-family HTH domain
MDEETETIALNNDHQIKAIELGALIHAHRLAADMSTTELAKRSGIDRSTIYRIEGGEFSEPSPQRLQRIASALGTEVEDYFALAGYFTTHGMPTLGPYLRTKYDVAPEVAEEVERYLRFLQQEGGAHNQTSNDSDQPHH